MVVSSGKVGNKRKLLSGPLQLDSFCILKAG